MPKLVCIFLPAVTFATYLPPVSDTGLHAQGLTLYVAPNGSDAWSGKLAEPKDNDGPFASIVRARDAVRQWKAAQGGLREPVTVRIRGGRYSLSETISFTSEDSGTQQCPISYEALPGEQPVIYEAATVYGTLQEATCEEPTGAYLGPSISHLRRLPYPPVGPPGSSRPAMFSSRPRRGGFWRLPTFKHRIARRRFLATSLNAGILSTWPVAFRGSLAAEAEPLFLEGYTDPMSVCPGERIRFHVSTSAKDYSLEIVRVGGEEEVVWKREDLPGGVHPVGDDTGKPAQAAMYGCDWPAAEQLTIPRDWRSGYYAVILSHAERRVGVLPSEQFDPGVMTAKPSRFIMFFVVRSKGPGRENKILLQLSTNTYHAYNNWGGSSLYSGPNFPRVSFNRPIYVFPWASPFTWEIPFIRWAERNGYGIDVCSNLDLEYHRKMLPPYHLILSIGHDEYWSAGMRDGLEAFITNGGNVAFFSGNTCCWQVRVEDNGRALVCYKRAREEDPVFKTGEHRQLTTLWSDPMLDRPENYLTGVGFPYGGYNGIFGSYEKGPGEGEYTVHRPDHWIFAGTGLNRGDTFGKEASIAGYEMDGCEFVLQDGVPVPTGRDGTPRNLEILATAPGHWAGGDSSIVWAREIRKAFPLAPGQDVPENFVEREGAGVLGIYSRGGTVVTAGSTDWAYGLAAGDRVVERITRNILDRLSG